MSIQYKTSECMSFSFLREILQSALTGISYKRGKKFTHDQCPFISQCKEKKVHFNPYIYAKVTNNP